MSRWHNRDTIDESTLENLGTLNVESCHDFGRICFLFKLHCFPNFGDLKHDFESKELKWCSIHPTNSQFMCVFMLQLIILFIIPNMSS